VAVEFSVIKEADLLSFRDAKEFSDEEGMTLYSRLRLLSPRRGFRVLWKYEKFTLKNHIFVHPLPKERLKVQIKKILNPS